MQRRENNKGERRGREGGNMKREGERREKKGREGGSDKKKKGATDIEK
jgi:hypothetical protein